MGKGKLAAMLIGCALIIVALVILLGPMFSYRKSNGTYDDIRDEYVSVAQDTEEGAEEAGEWWNAVEVDFDALSEVNPDIVGWIYSDTVEQINYPVLWSGDDETYLRSDIYGNYTVAGCIFLEGQNDPAFKDAHTIIYGHNMRNLSMFGTLKEYKEDGYYEDNRYFTIYTPKAAYRYEIFAYRDVDADDEVYTVGYQHDDIFGDFIEELNRKSYKDTGVSVEKSDYVVTLSTCSSDDMRFVVHGVRVDEHWY